MKLTGRYRERFMEEATTCRTIGYYLYLFMTACLWILNDFQREIPVTVSNVLKLQAALAILLAAVYGIILWEEYTKQLQLQRQEVRMKRTRSKSLMLGLVILAFVLPAYAADRPAKSAKAPVPKPNLIPITTSTAPLTSDYVAKIFRAEIVHKFIQNNLFTSFVPLKITIGDITIGFGVDQFYVTKNDEKITKNNEKMMMAVLENGWYCWSDKRPSVTCTDLDGFLSGISRKDLIDAINAILADQSTADIK